MKFDPVTVGLVIGATTLAPIAFLTVTSFVKVSVVLAIVRNALGGQQVPSGAVTSLLALALTLHIMTPVAEEMWEKLANFPAEELLRHEAKDGKTSSLAAVFERVKGGSEPLERFLRKHSEPKEREFFARRPDGGTREESFLTLIPAFLISELSRAFAIGVMVFLPFLVIDLVLTNIFVALGMSMVNPMAVTFPVKLLLFVVSDGWAVLCHSLVLSYT